MLLRVQENGCLLMAPKKARFKGIRDVGYWHFAAFAATHQFGREWTKSGQRQAPALNGSVAIDPGCVKTHRWI
jgi:hypothetical protein